MMSFKKSLILLALALWMTPDAAQAQLSQIQRSELRDNNLLGPFNPGFENGKQYWVNTSGTFAITTTSTLIGSGTTSGQWTAAGSGNTLTSKSTTVPAGLFGAACQVSILHKGGDANVVLEAFDVTTSTALGQLTLAAATNYVLDVIPFICPAAADSINLRLRATAASALFDLDSAFLGTPAFTGIVSTSPVVYSQPKTVVGAVGTAGQINAGHALTTTEWPFTIAGKLAFYNLSSSATTDNSTALSCTSGTAACTLTNTGTAPVTATDIFGASNAAVSFNGSTQTLNTTDQFFNPAAANSYAMGGWFKLTNWASGSPQMLISSDFGGTAGHGYMLSATSTGQIDVTDFSDGSGASGVSAEATSIATGWTAGSWHHVAYVYDKSAQLMKVYGDGRLLATTSMNRTVATTNIIFRISGRQNSVIQLFTGSAEQVFFQNSSSYVMTDDDIRKIFAYSWAHNKAVSTANQWLHGNWYRADSNVANQLSSAWVVHKDSNTLYTDFSDMAATAFVDFSLANQAMTATTIPVNSYDSGWSSTTPATTLAHGLGAIPSRVEVNYESATPSAGNYQTLNSGDYCSYDATNIYCDWDTLTIDSTHLIRVQAFLPGTSVAVQAAGSANSGIVNTTAQTFAGAKTFSTPIDGSSVAAASTSATGTISHEKQRTTYTPAITGSGGNPTITYTANSDVGTYTQIGDLVFVTMFLQWSASSGGSGDMRISLPVTANGSITNNYTTLGCEHNNIDTQGIATRHQMNCEIAPAGTYCSVVEGGDAVTSVTTQISETQGGTFNKYMVCSGSYFWN